MKREERNEYNHIRRTVKNIGPGSLLTIRTDAGAEYKQALHEFYTSLGFHPASITVDARRFDEKERIIYIEGLNWRTQDGRSGSWEELYTKEEKAAFAAALQ